MSIPIQVSQIGTGSTVDISSSGVAFIIDTALSPGSTIDFALKMTDHEAPFELHCGGTVVRVERRGERVFTAATIERLTVQNKNGH